MRQNYQKCINVLSLLICVILSQYTAVAAVYDSSCGKTMTSDMGLPVPDFTFAGCSGTSTEASQGSFTTGYNYNFETVGTSVIVTCTLLDNKSGVVAYLWQQTPFGEQPMTNTSGLTFTRTLTGQTVGQTITYAVKFAYAGGLSVTKWINYVVGDNCSTPPADNQAPTDFTATAGTVTSSSVQLLLNATDNSGAVTYTITYGGNTTTVSGNSGVQQSKVINGLSPSTAYSFSITAKDASNNMAANNPIVVNATTSVDTNTMCTGTSSQAAEGSFTTGYSYNFQSSGGSVTATFTLLDTDKTGVVAYLWRETPFGEFPMTNSSGLTFTRTLTGLTPGASVKLGVKFAFADGLSRTKYFTYTVGDNCTPPVSDTQAPTSFTATAGIITSSSVDLLLNGSDDSGALTYTITYGGNSTTVTAASGVQQTKTIMNLSPSTAYSFSVTATDAAGNTAANNPIVVNATTLVDTSTACSGTSSQAAEGSFSTGYSYDFTTSGTSVTATFTLLDTDKTGVVAYLWRETPFGEFPMTNSSGLTFTRTLTGLTPGATVKLGVKFAYAGGLSRTKYFTYTVGDTCGVVVPDTEAPTNFTATAGTITSNSVELLLNGTDDSGAVKYTITYGGNTVIVTGASGVQESKIITDLSSSTEYNFSVAATDTAGNTAANDPIVVTATTLVDTSTACSGISSVAAEGSFSTGYSYDFETSGTSVTATFTMLDTDKSGVIAYLWRETPFAEFPMTNSSGLTFTKTVTGLTPGATVKFSVKFAYAGGLSRTKYFTYTVGDTCGEVAPDTQSPTDFTATVGAITSTSVELLLNGSDDSGAVTYNIAYGAANASTGSASGVQRSFIIHNLTPETPYSFSVTASDLTGNTAANNPIVVNATTIVDTNNACFGSSSEAAEGNFSIGYTYNFRTDGTSVIATFTLLDEDKSGVIAYLRQQTPFSETGMAASGLTFTKTLTGLTPGATYNFAVKFAYAGGQSVTKYFPYTVGDICGVPRTTQIKSSQCGATFPNFLANIGANVILQASAYRFRITYNGNTEIIERLGRSFKLNMLEDYAFGTDYIVEVAVKIGGVWEQYGQACTISTVDIPTTELRDTHCGAVIPNIYFSVQSNPVEFAEAYRFRVINGANEQIFVSPVKNFKFRQLGSYTAGMTYTVEVAVQMNGNWGDYGPVCSVTLGSISPFRNNMESEEEDAVTEMKVIAFPNPYEDTFTLSGDFYQDSPVTVQAYDLTGKLLDNMTVNPSEIEGLKLGQRYAAGIYNVIITQGTEQKFLKMVKK
jgi:trimeric autotransporter adhesin